MLRSSGSAAAFGMGACASPDLAIRPPAYAHFNRPSDRCNRNSPMAREKFQKISVYQYSSNDHEPTAEAFEDPRTPDSRTAMVSSSHCPSPFAPSFNPEDRPRGGLRHSAVEPESSNLPPLRTILGRSPGNPLPGRKRRERVPRRENHCKRRSCEQRIERPRSPIPREFGAALPMRIHKKLLNPRAKFRINVNKNKEIRAEGR